MRPRAREVGVEIGLLETGRSNSITDVEGISVGHVTLIKGSGGLIPGKGPIRTGVTAILPHEGNLFKEKVPAGSFVMNGFGKSIGLVQMREFGNLETPILLTNTLNVSIVADGLIEYMLQQNEDIGVTTGSVNPVVMECNDQYLNDLRGRHVKREHVLQALNEASKEVEEGAIGAGTGMSAFKFKGGIGTSSRIAEILEEEYTVGSLALTNFGRREDLIIRGVHVGRELGNPPAEEVKDGSLIVILATDAPLSSRQLGRLAKRSVVGATRTGAQSYNTSGDIFVAFSTANKIPHYAEARLQAQYLPDRFLNSLFKACAEATEEAIVNSLFRARTMDGRDDHVREALPMEKLLQILADS